MCAQTASLFGVAATDILLFCNREELAPDTRLLLSWPLLDKAHRTRQVGFSACVCFLCFFFLFLFSSLFFSQVVDVEACHKGLASVVLKKDDLRQASSGDIPRMGDEMNSATKTAVQNLKMLESICREPNVDRGAFLKIAKETAISVHALMRLAQDKGLNAVHDVLNENVGRVIGLGKELIKERAEQGEETDGVVEGEFVAAMKAMGESIK